MDKEKEWAERREALRKQQVNEAGQERAKDDFNRHILNDWHKQENKNLEQAPVQKQYEAFQRQQQEVARQRDDQMAGRKAMEARHIQEQASLEKEIAQERQRGQEVEQSRMNEKLMPDVQSQTAKDYERQQVEKAEQQRKQLAEMQQMREEQQRRREQSRGRSW